ncbi:hypothetical protein Ccrd_000638 [Cynara cardunculus var. scolymus]|uniref:Protein kinase domain-containing protein n=1 Tax=Cynara cardunculus var. scolymus TaxID=59895 RepID=A0A103XUQ2_CYNCS|nr:hypothetical protein Ccrd_000638 [Cynara cardunculus var. scolymus]
MYGNRKDSSGKRTPDGFNYPPSPTPSSYSTYSSKSSSDTSTPSRNRVKVAARSVAGVFVACFTPPEEETHHKSSSGFGGSDAFSSTSDVSGASDTTDGRKRGANRSIYATRNDSTHMREPGSIKFTLAEIHKATKNFSPALKVGQGGFGTVYKGQLQDGTLVAVKRAKKSMYDKNLGGEFQSEIQALSTVEHLNLVKCYGYLEHGDERIIVVEYVPNGTLREHLECKLFPPRKRNKKNVIICLTKLVIVVLFLRNFLILRCFNGNVLSLASRLDIAIDAMKKFMDGVAISILDPGLEKSDVNASALEKILELALQCVASHRQNRPIMRRCVEVLWNIRKDYKEVLG